MATVTEHQHPVHADGPDAPAGAVAVPVGDSAALVDDADAELVGAYEWRPLHGNTGKIYAYVAVKGRVIYMHRLVACAEPGFEIDHINGDGLDNRRDNLRAATRTQNRVNSGKPRRPGKPYSSVYKGVVLVGKRWRAQIKIRGRVHHLGLFAFEADAARAYDRAAVAAWGQFARPNFSDEVTS